jgi:hypothetical protein
MIHLFRKDFTARHLTENEPVLVSDGLFGWPATLSWSPQLLATILAHRRVDVSVSTTGVFRYKPDGDALDSTNQFTIRDIPFKDAVDSILDESPWNPKYYVSQQDLRSKLPELLPDLRFPENCEPTTISLWFGSSGTVTPLHFDRSNNLFAQIYGSKRFVIFSPEETPYLYQFPQGSRLAHLSYVNLEDPDWHRHELLQRAQRTTFTIQPGELLFLPAFWWHHVRANTISISVNQWSPRSPDVS